MLSALFESARSLATIKSKLARKEKPSFKGACEDSSPDGGFPGGLPVAVRAQRRARRRPVPRALALPARRGHRGGRRGTAQPPAREPRAAYGGGGEVAGEDGAGFELLNRTDELTNL